MKITLEIPVAIFRRANSAAARRRMPLREFVTEAVAEKLIAGAKQEDKPWVNLAGGLKHLHQETLCINRILEEEFNRIDGRNPWTL